MEPLLSVRDLTVTFGSFTAVDRVSFDLHEGQTLAVVGESGSGKSVTALSIMRLVELGTRGKIENGEILFRQPNGEVIDLVQQREDNMREIRGNAISMIFQEPLTSLNPVYPVGDQVAEAVMLHQRLDKAEAAERVIEMFRLVRIPEPEKRMAQCSQNSTARHAPARARLVMHGHVRANEMAMRGRVSRASVATCARSPSRLLGARSDTSR